jgi:hypothetical protein
VKIEGKAATGSVFGGLGGAAPTGLLVGDFYISPVSVNGTVGDSWRVLTETQMVDLSGWSIEIAADEIDTTVLSDNFKKYRKGKKDANGSAKFVYIKGVTDIAGGLAEQFFKIANIDATGDATVSEVNGDPVYLVGYVDQTTGLGNVKLATIMQVEFFNFALPMNMGEAVNIDTPFRLVGDSDPILYRITNPAS